MHERASQNRERFSAKQKFGTRIRNRADRLLNCWLCVCVCVCVCRGVLYCIVLLCWREDRQYKVGGVRAETQAKNTSQARQEKAEISQCSRRKLPCIGMMDTKLDKRSGIVV
jgi:hypothetical protein